LKSKKNPFDLKSYNYDLPTSLIATEPLEKRESAKMLVFHRESQKIEHRKVADILDYLDEKTLFVANNTKVFPARLVGKRATGAYLELLLVKELADKIWECKVLNSKKIKLGEVFSLAANKITAKLLAKNPQGLCRVEFFCEQNFFQTLQKVGQAPLPPYILKQRKKQALGAQDKHQYQTVYAEKYGSIAAPTAGLHFSTQLLADIKKKCDSGFVTLHVGLGTFEPVKVNDIREHKIHKEYYEITAENTNKILLAKKQNKRILAIGTTTTRALESLHFLEQKNTTATSELFIYPSYVFQNVGSLLTNFHLPQSSLMMLVAAFCGLEALLEIYQIAIKENYRFYSYGDCMLIL
jgi:S-adenosylmethionine:tRNA ribosyltransferase-isomerase